MWHRAVVGWCSIALATLATGAEPTPKPGSEAWKEAEAALAKVEARIYEQGSILDGVTLPLVQLGAKAGDDVLKQLPEVPFPHAITLQYTQVTDAGMSALKERKHLVRVDIGFTEVGEQA